MNPVERRRCLDQTGFAPAPQKPFAEYLKDLRASYLCLSPAGDGIDTHRTWESLYLGTVPVVTRSVLTEASILISRDGRARRLGGVPVDCVLTGTARRTDVRLGTPLRCHSTDIWSVSGPRSGKFCLAAGAKRTTLPNWRRQDRVGGGALLHILLQIDPATRSRNASPSPIGVDRAARARPTPTAKAMRSEGSAS